MKQIVTLLGLLTLSACAHLGLSSAQGERTEIWKEAHRAFEAQEFARAADLFDRLHKQHPESLEGREALFYSGALHLDPRNPAWDPVPAEELLTRYLAADSARKVTVHRRPEGTTLFQLARQLNMPPRERVPGLQPETEVVTREVEVPRRVVVPAEESRALAAEVQRLRTQLAERDATIQQQREELERIRRTLTRPSTD